MRRSRSRKHEEMGIPTHEVHMGNGRIDYMGGLPRINPDDPKLAHASPELRAILLGEAKPAAAEPPKPRRTKKAAAKKEL